MPSNRIVYQNWIADLGRDPASSTSADLARFEELVAAETGEALEVGRLEYLQQTVRSALGGLSEDERELVEQIHFMGRSCAEMAALTGRTEHRLEALHGRALHKLRRKLAPLVRELFGIDPPAVTDCPICRSSHRPVIDRLIRERDPRLTWRPVMKLIEAETGIRISTPQTIIGHEKYH